MKQKHIHIIIFLLSTYGFLNGQSIGAFINAADNAFDREDYFSASSYYKTTLEYDSTRTDLRYRLAESLRLFNAYSKSIEQYHIVLESKDAEKYPLIHFWLGNLYQKTGDYEEAIKYFEIYISEYGDKGNGFAEKARMHIAACEWAISEVEMSDPDVMITKLGDEVNTPYNEFGTFILKDDLYFTSMKYQAVSGKKPKKLISKIQKKDQEGLVSPVAGDINISDNSIAHGVVNKTGTKLYYTVCEYLTDSRLVCEIYCRDITPDGQFINPVRLTINTDEEGKTSTQPALGFDPVSGNEFIIFSSDRQGGKGKMDLWKADIIGKNQFSDPKPIEFLNTPEDDITPYYHDESGILYFSTNGRIGFGGFDIFSSYKLTDGFSDPVNLGATVNSSYHDIYYFVSQDEETAYFSSNRIGSYFIDELEEACCYDVYEVNYSQVKLQLNTLTFDALTRDSLEGVTVYLIDPLSKEILAEVTNNQGIDHIFDLRRGRNYTVRAEKEGFNPQEIMVSTRGPVPDGTIIRKIYLTTDNLLLDVYTFHATSLEPLDNVTLEIFDLSNERELVYRKYNPLNNNFRTYVVPGHVYEVRAIREGFCTSTLIVDTNTAGNEKILTRRMYLEDCSLDVLLPLALYFDNDRPDGRSLDLYTARTYSETFNSYIDRLNTYKQRYSSPLRGEAKEIAEKEMEAFFDENIKEGYSRLYQFLDRLIEYLKDGKSADISIKGHTSPLAANRYNLALGQRRVSSIKNEIARYKNGIFMPFLTSGQLSITDVSFGEEIAPANVSDSSSDLRRSVYSVRAARERRVEIIRIKLN
ncbi:MAG TPA: tetratricopeptide repeat protein [Saprospiraceae bacterium]|nr:tetratricopeptide repeat protein [Saprospiraceae bacterium]